MDLDVGDSKFIMTVYDMTNRSDISMLQSNLFFINADNGTSTADSNARTSTPESSQEISASTGLATGAKAGIGAGIGVLALILLLAGFFLYRRKKRQTASIAPTDGLEKPELDAKSTGISEVDGSGISPRQAPDNAIYEAPGVLVHEAPTGKEQTVVEKMRAARQINEEPIEMPADSPMSSPKTSQDRLNRT